MIADPPHHIAEHRSRLLQRRYGIPRRTAAIPSDPVKSCVPVVVPHPDGSANLVRRAKARLKNSAELRKQGEQIERQLGLNTEDQV